MNFDVCATYDCFGKQKMKAKQLTATLDGVSTATGIRAERNLIIKRVRCGMRRARLEGRQIGRSSPEIDRASVVRHREHGLSLGQIAKIFSISRATVRLMESTPKPLFRKGVALTLCMKTGHAFSRSAYLHLERTRRSKCRSDLLGYCYVAESCRHAS